MNGGLSVSTGRGARAMTAAIFLVTAFAMFAAAGGRRDIALTLFGVAFLVSIMWLEHHMTDPLKLALSAPRCRRSSASAMHWEWAASP